ncbi:hypothetical protein [Henriciella sp.]|uniref:hypothetical protein n=1 Tax=Henriciella sp. TaxID=1968823 RepID=UPI0026257C83|nr:hypothetical protein [Henriciella sp.]
MAFPLAAVEALRKGADGIKGISEAVAARLGNPTTIARNSYIHPKLVEMARDKKGWRTSPALSDYAKTSGGCLPFWKPTRSRAYLGHTLRVGV